RRYTVTNALREMFLECRDRKRWSSLDRIGFGNETWQVPVRDLMIGSVHPEHRIAHMGASTPFERFDPRHEIRSVPGHAGTVAVPLGQIFRSYGGSVGRFPAKCRGLHRGWDTAPHDGILEAEPGQNLRHLRDMAEHVGEIPDRHGPTPLLGL